MNSRLHIFDYISRFGFLFLFIFFYTVPGFHSFLEKEKHSNDFSTCSVHDEVIDIHGCLEYSTHEIGCTHTNHLKSTSAPCEICALLFSLKITTTLLYSEEGVLSQSEKSSSSPDDQNVYALSQSTQDSRGPPLFF
jgi:hypothetical protein